MQTKMRAVLADTDLALQSCASCDFSKLDGLLQTSKDMGEEIEWILQQRKKRLDYMVNRLAKSTSEIEKAEIERAMESLGDSDSSESSDESDESDESDTAAEPPPKRRRLVRKDKEDKK
jgi:hypothetical protein